MYELKGIISEFGKNPVFCSSYFVYDILAIIQKEWLVLLKNKRKTLITETKSTKYYKKQRSNQFQIVIC